jgi:hypothetical protein
MTKLRNPRSAALAMMGLLIVGSLGCTSRHAPLTNDPVPTPTTRETLEENWGVRVLGVRSSAAETILDFRYRIVDSTKAARLVDRTVDPFLMDQASGLQVGVPVTAKIGPLRQTQKYGEPKEGQTYFILFGNPGGTIRPGNLVTVTIGDFKVEDLIVR